jgi:5'-3' exonuclease
MDEIFAAIYNYTDLLINHMRPRKRLFIAIDGVAPRAKMNNQRQRRYHSARSNKSLNEFLTEDLHTSPGVISFKNNSISPGTEFMFDLIEKIKFFVLRKIHEDHKWKNIEVIVSGGDVPGEGEHKIMEWLRGWKQSADYDINESHCIYSNDADLIFLGLSTHIPKLLILREVQNFNDDNKVNSATKREQSNTELELLYLNVLREYMTLEYQQDQTKYNHPFDIERVIDDFILVAFFIGNDFLHQMYCMSTKMGNFDEMVEIFKNTLPTLGGYLSNKGYINWDKFAVFLKNIQRLEGKMIKTTLDEMKDSLRETRTSQKVLFTGVEREELEKDGGRGMPKLVLRKDNSGYEGNPEDIQSESSEEEAKMLESEAKQFDNKGVAQAGAGLKKLTKNFELEMQLYYLKIKKEAEFIGEMHKAFSSQDPQQIKSKKLEFYKRFFGIDSLDQLDKIGLEYLKGLQFVMFYYFHGCPSWTWYYPYFISPFLSDLITVLEKYLGKLDFKFDRAGPFKPYDQLAYILPKASLGLLPNVYQETLTTDPRSAKYYPDKLDEFEPFDGIHDYQWIAKLELFDDKVMAEVLNGIDQKKLSAEEIRRNKPGVEYCYKWDKNTQPISFKSVIKGLPDFQENILITPFNTEEKYPFDPTKISHSQKGEDKDDGFPSLHILPGVECYLQEIKKRFGNYKRLVLKFYSSGLPKPSEPYQRYVFYDYPFKKIGYVNTVITRDNVRACGNLAPEVVNDISEERRLKNPADIAKAVEKESLADLYKDKGIDYDTEGMSEVFYAIEYRKSAWRTAKDMAGTVVYEFEQVPYIIPQGLLMPFSINLTNKYDTQFKFPVNESQLFQPGMPLVSLFNGDFLIISDPQPKNDPINIYGDIIKPNNNLSKEVVTAADLLEDRWDVVDAPTLKEFGLDASQILVLYGILDSMVIKTDLSKTSSLILGSLFDIGLKFYNALGVYESKVLIVIDLVR